MLSSVVAIGREMNGSETLMKRFSHAKNAEYVEKNALLLRLRQECGDPQGSPSQTSFSLFSASSAFSA